MGLLERISDGRGAIGGNFYNPDIDSLANLRRRQGHAGDTLTGRA
jgi:hypothetical protein